MVSTVCLTELLGFGYASFIQTFVGYCYAVEYFACFFLLFFSFFYLFLCSVELKFIYTLLISKSLTHIKYLWSVHLCLVLAFWYVFAYYFVLLLFNRHSRFNFFFTYIWLITIYMTIVILFFRLFIRVINVLSANDTCEPVNEQEKQKTAKTTFSLCRTLLYCFASVIRYKMNLFEVSICTNHIWSGLFLTRGQFQKNDEWKKLNRKKMTRTTLNQKKN